MRKKDKRHSGWVTPRPTIPLKVLHAEDLFIDKFYDDWEDYRDGQRNITGDRTKFKKNSILRKMITWMDDNTINMLRRNNMKLKRHLKRRIKKIRLKNNQVT